MSFFIFIAGGFIVKKSKKIILAIACVIIVAVLAIAKVTDGSVATVKCTDCNGTGIVHEVECPVCGGSAEYAGKNCTACSGVGVLNDAECENCGGEGEVRASFWALVPPVIAIALALITKEVYSSLFIGILAGAILGSDFVFTGTMDILVNDSLIEAVSGTAGIFIFLVVLGVIVALVNKAGGSAAFGKWAQKHIKSRSGAMIATFVLGVLIFIDDYFNCLTVGSVMRPVTDGHKVSRAKLSYLIDATAAPICMIAPISSWAAAVASYADEGQGIALFIRAIPFNFYSLLTFVFIIGLTLMKFDYGPMRIHELNAKKNGDLYTSGDKAEVEESDPSSNGKVLDLVLPIVVLIAVCVFALVYVGGIFDGSGFVEAFSNTDATVGLPWGSIIALVFTIIYLCARKLVSFKEAMECIPKGFIAMVPAILILTFATSLKNTTAVLGAKPFVADVWQTLQENSRTSFRLSSSLLPASSPLQQVLHGVLSVFSSPSSSQSSPQAQFRQSVCLPALQVLFAATTALRSRIRLSCPPPAVSATTSTMFQLSFRTLYPLRRSRSLCI